MNTLNIIGEAIVRQSSAINPSFLDSDNILWKVVYGEWIGKRSVWTFDFTACWLEDTDAENVSKWWCGEDADYQEIFYRRGE